MPSDADVSSRGPTPPLPELLRIWRDRALITQEELAERSGLGVRTVRRLEAGRHRPQLASMRRLADALNLTDQERKIVAAAVSGPQSRHPAPVGLLPRQLPAPVRHFVGRTTEMRLLSEAASVNETIVISAVTGTAGIGKTALALHWAHQHADQFPDGQLYANLRGYHPIDNPVSPATVIRWFLGALGVLAHRIPQEIDAQSALYRSVLANRSMLIVLDNARDAEQIWPLLPGAGDCLVLVTSRDQLTSLVVGASAVKVHLDLMPIEEARQLITCHVGNQRTLASQHAVEEIIDSCARLPLALAIAAARAASLPQMDLADLAAQLRAAQHRLDALDTSDQACDPRTVFSWSYHSLSPHVARLFKLMGFHPGPDINTAAAASLAAVTTKQVTPLLNELTAANMVTEHAPGRYTTHDLLRAYAAEQARTLAPRTASAATHRLLDHYLQTAHAAAHLLHPHREPTSPPAPRPGVNPEPLTETRQALDWFTAERLNLLALMDLASSTDQPGHIWHLAMTMTQYLDRAGHWHDQLAVQRNAFTAASRLGEFLPLAHAYHNLARAHLQMGAHEPALTHLRQALDLHHELGDDHGQAFVLHTFAHLYGRLGNQIEAINYIRRALKLHRLSGNLVGQAEALNTLGWRHGQLGEHRRTISYCRQALTLHQKLGNSQGQAATWDSLGYAHHHLGDHAKAITCYQKSLSLIRSLGDRHAEASVLNHLGDAHHAKSDPVSARAAWQNALAIFDALEHPDADSIRAKLESGT